MKVYDIADLKVGLDCQERTTLRAQKYLCSDFKGEPDFVIATTPEEIRARRLVAPEEIKAYLHEGKLFYQTLVDRYNGMMLHSSAVVVDDKAYLFTAPSGTGKSTHTNFWLELFGDRAYILNDDKPAVRILDDGIYAFGTPWSGKHDISVNNKVKLQGICILKRADENKISLVNSSEAVIRLVQSTFFNIDKELVAKLLKIIEKIVLDVPVWELSCKPEIEAAKISYEAMSGEKL